MSRSWKLFQSGWISINISKTFKNIFFKASSVFFGLFDLCQGRNFLRLNLLSVVNTNCYQWTHRAAIKTDEIDNDKRPDVKHVSCRCSLSHSLFFGWTTFPKSDLEFLAVKRANFFNTDKYTRRWCTWNMNCDEFFFSLRCTYNNSEWKNEKNWKNMKKASLINNHVGSLFGLTLLHCASRHSSLWFW